MGHRSDHSLSISMRKVLSVIDVVHAATAAMAGVARKSVSRVHTAQMMRPSLLATAIVALLCPRRACT